MFSVTFSGRTVAQDTELRGVQLKKGDKITCILPACNYDPEAFPNPREVDFHGWFGDFYARVPPHTSADMADRVDAQIERYAPGFRSTVLARSVRTPADIERDNPSLVSGDLAAGSFEADQQLIFRPDPRLCRYRTPLRGLYVAGGWVHPGAGVHGMSGWNAARMILADRPGRHKP